MRGGSYRGYCATCAVAVLCQLIHNLVKCRENVVRELHLCDGCVAGHTKADCKSSDCLLCNGCVEHTVLPVLVPQPFRTAKDAAKSDILACSRAIASTERLSSLIAATAFSVK